MLGSIFINIISFNSQKNPVNLIFFHPSNAAKGVIRVESQYSGEGHGHPLQYSCLESLMGRRAQPAVVQRAGHN